MTDDEIKTVFNGLPGFAQWTCTATQLKFASAIIAAYQAKLLAGVSIVNELQAWWDSGNEQYIELERIVHQYAAACAAQAREKALDEAKQVCIAEHGACWHANAIAASMAAQRCAAAIDKLKGGE